VLKTRLTDFTVEVPDRHYLLGQWVPITVRFRLKRAIEVANIKVALRGMEKYSSGKSTHTHNFHEQEHCAVQEVVLAPAPEDGVQQGPDQGIYRSLGRPESTGPVFTWRTGVKLPADGLASVGDSVFYQVKATADVLGWPDPSAEVKVKTAGAKVEFSPAAPPHDHPRDTSPGLVFVPRGQAMPAGVEAPTSGSGLWGWIFICLVGVVALIGSGILLFEMSRAMMAVVAAASALAALGAGLWGFFNKLR